MEDNKLDTTISEVDHRPSWTDLTTEQKNAVLALSLAKSVNEAARIFKTTTKRSRAYFYAKVYPVIKDYWKDLAVRMPDEAMRILQGGSVLAAKELVDEIQHRDVKIRNKASNDILDKTLPRTPQVMQQFNVGGKEGNNITFVNFKDETTHKG